MFVRKIKTLLSVIVEKLLIPFLIIIVFHIIVYYIIRNTGFMFPIYMVILYVLLSTVLALYFIVIE